MSPPSPGEDPAATAGATLPPLTWQDLDLRRGCGSEASDNADAINDDYYKDNGGNGNDGDGGCNLALSQLQPHPHLRSREGDCDASPPWWRLALNIETFNVLVHSMQTRGSNHIVLRAHHIKKIHKDRSTR
jgi:hypothetical protein